MENLDSAMASLDTAWHGLHGAAWRLELAMWKYMAAAAAASSTSLVSCLLI
uniref:Uncharacterized protein n=1 Tax=Arundo donax TaxID=35708 RepID=A0A0A8XTC6_ARUDO